MKINFQVSEISVKMQQIGLLYSNNGKKYFRPYTYLLLIAKFSLDYELVDTKMVKTSR